jgi:glycosyltransferase involved in cell wall biosynthesis
VKLFTVMISYFRRELTEQAIQSYRDTVTLPHALWIVDNGSDEETQEWLFSLAEDDIIDGLCLFPTNVYPGKAFNTVCDSSMGIAEDTTHLHRADNDFIFLPGWCEHVQERFKKNTRLGQLGLRTDVEEQFAPFNVGGNMILARRLWQKGLRYDERPWPELPAGYSEDSYLTPAVVEMGWHWGRVQQPCIQSISREDAADPYYQKTWSDRGIYQKKATAEAE